MEPLEAERIVERLDSLREAWSDLREDLLPLMAGQTLVPANANVAALEAGAFIGSLGDADETTLRHNLAAFMAGNVNLATVSRLAVENGDAVAPAAAVNRVMKELAPNAVGSADDPVALHHRRTIPLPDALRKDLGYRFTELADVSARTSSGAPVVTPMSDAARAAREASAHGPSTATVNPQAQPSPAAVTRPSAAAQRERGRGRK